jgi:hypothetical protein
MRGWRQSILHVPEAAKVEQERGFFARVWSHSEKQQMLSDVPTLSAGLIQTLWGEVQRKRELAESVTASLPQEVVATLVEASLGQASILLRTYEAASSPGDSPSPIVADFVEVDFQRIATHVKLRPTSSAIDLEIASMVASECWTTGSKRGLVLAAENTSGAPLLSLGVELKPLDGHADLVVSLRMSSIDVVYSAPFVDRCTVFFSSTGSSSVTTDENVSDGDSASNQTLDLNIVVEAPNLVMPLSFLDPHCPRLVLAFGELALHTNLEHLTQQPVSLGEDGKKHVSIEYFYQQAFDFDASKIRLLLVHDEQWRDYLERVPNNCAVVENLSLGMQIAMLTFPTKLLPKLRMTASLLSSPIAKLLPSDLADVLLIVDAILPSTDPAAQVKPLPAPSASATTTIHHHEDVAQGQSSKLLDDEFVFDDESLLPLGDPVALDIRFEAEKVELLLYESGVDHDVGLARLQVHKFTVGFVARVDQSVDLVTTIDSLSLLDERPQAVESRFKNLIIKPDDEHAPPLLSLKYSSHEQEMDMTVAMCPVQCFVVLPLVKQALSWNTMVQAKLGPALSARNEQKEPIIPRAQPPPQEGGRTRCQVLLPRIEVIIPEATNVQSPRAIGMSASFQVDYEAHGAVQEMQLLVTDVSVSKQGKLMPDVKAQLVESWGVTVSYRDTANVATCIDVLFPRLEVLINHSDCVLAMELLALLSEDTVEEDPEQSRRLAEGMILRPRETVLILFFLFPASRQLVVEPRRALHEGPGVLGGTAGVMDLLPFDVLDEVQAQCAEARVEQPVETPSTKLETLTVVLQGIKVQLVDDAGGQYEPLMSLVLRESRAIVSAWSVRPSAVTDLSFMADFFNPRARAWEPILRGRVGTDTQSKDDFWTLRARLESAKDTGSMQLKLTALESACVTVSHAMISSIQRISAFWLQLLKESALRSKSSALLLDADLNHSHLQTHVLFNYTGISLRWALEGMEPMVLHATRGSNCISFRGQNTRHRNRPGLMQVFMPDGTVLKDLPVDGARRRCFSLDRNTTLVYEIHFEDAMRVIELRSSIMFVSEATESVRINVIRADEHQRDARLSLDTSPQLVFEVLGHEHFGLPLNMCHHSWRIGAPAGTPFDWTELHLDIKVLRKEAETTLNGVLKYAHIVPCHAQEKGAYDWAYAVTAVGTPDAISHDQMSWIVTIGPPLTVRNLLNVSIKYKLLDMRDRKGEMPPLRAGVLERGGALELYQHNPNESLSLTIQVEGFAWSEPLVLGAGSSTTMLDDMERELEVHADTILDGVTQTVSLWVPFWLINHTRMGLLFQTTNGPGAILPVAGQDLPVYERWTAASCQLPMAEWFTVPEQREALMFSDLCLSFVIGDSQPAPALVLASASDTGVLTVPRKVDERLYELGVRCFASPGDFWRTKILQIDNRYHMVNMTDRLLLVTQRGSPHVVELQPNTQVPFHWMNGGSNPDSLQICVKLASGSEEDEWLWSGSFRLTQVSLFDVAVLSSDHVKRVRMAVQIHTENPLTAVVFRPSTTPIYKISNLTPLPLLIKQVGVTKDEGERLDPGESDVLYVWPEPTADKPRVEVSICDGAHFVSNHGIPMHGMGRGFCVGGMLLTIDFQL